eukprot:TRINITY_DN2381_c0_g3_i2.p1 TRINITY_DN2381_c0_g3~~TRINITY_DN2381_c0_g3_i2.p1  ORF type:complete len:517 (+),score=82.09 TRINITY_DN2381_c0_g3_i2:67-1617(+)
MQAFSVELLITIWLAVAITESRGSNCRGGSCRAATTVACRSSQNETCNSIEPTLGWQLLQTRQEVVAKKTRSDMETGLMTMWSDSDTTIVGGSCEYANAANGGLISPAASSPYVALRAYCAADAMLYAGGAACGSCWRVSYDGSPATDPGRPGSSIVQIVDSGSAKTFDCQVVAYEAITGSRTGVFPISYEPVECETSSGGAVATVLDGNNAWYTKVIFSNLPFAVISADISIAGTTFSMNRVGGATWSASTGGKTGVVSFLLVLDGGATASLTSCFSSWPVATGTYCSSGGTLLPPTPAPSPTPSPAPTPSTPSPAPTPSPSPAPTPSPSPAPTPCSSSGEDCRSTTCCTQAGFTCYEKDQWWAGCLESCMPGINPNDPPQYQTPWTCRPLDEAATSLTTTASPRFTTTTTTPFVETKVFEPVDGGVDRACRGANSGDNSPGYYKVFSRTNSMDDCKNRCVSTNGCVGVEFKGSRCEIWTRAGGIQATSSISGFTCDMELQQGCELEPSKLLMVV